MYSAAYWRCKGNLINKNQRSIVVHVRNRGMREYRGGMVIFMYVDSNNYFYCCLKVNSFGFLCHFISFSVKSQKHYIIYKPPPMLVILLAQCRKIIFIWNSCSFPLTPTFLFSSLFSLGDDCCEEIVYSVMPGIDLIITYSRESLCWYYYKCMSMVNFSMK